LDIVLAASSGPNCEPLQNEELRWGVLEMSDLKSIVIIKCQFVFSGLGRLQGVGKRFDAPQSSIFAWFGI